MSAELTIHPMPFTRVELCAFSLINGQLSVLLGKRQSAPYRGQWALPGGVLRIDIDSDLEGAAQRIAQERLGVALPYLRQQCVVGGKDRDPRAPWALAVIYRALVRLEDFHPRAGKRLEELQWFPVSVPQPGLKLAFDHQQVIEMATQDLREEVDRLELPFGFLPATFTLGELQEVCEQLLGHPLDKSSFRRRLENTASVTPVENEFKRGANRPAQVFRAR